MVGGEVFAGQHLWVPRPNADDAGVHWRSVVPVQAQGAEGQ